MESDYGLGYFKMKNGDKVSYELEGFPAGKSMFIGVINQLTKTHARITIPSREGAYIVLPISAVRLCD